MNIEGKLAVITGGASGLGRATAEMIVANGGKCTFNGRIHIHDGASGTDAQLSNKNLGMGDNATINTKPELEIYTDDVSCSHGATVGTLSQEALFYLTSRVQGIAGMVNLGIRANVDPNGLLPFVALYHLDQSKGGVGG